MRRHGPAMLFGRQVIEEVLPEVRDDFERTLPIRPQRTDSLLLKPIPEHLTWMLYTHSEEKCSSVCHTYNLRGASNAGDTAAFLNKAWATHGYRFAFAVHHGEKRVVCLTKKGKFAARDIEPWLDLGYSEFLYDLSFSTKWFRLPSGEIVRLFADVDVTPKKTLQDAFVWRKVLGNLVPA